MEINQISKNLKCNGNAAAAGIQVGAAAAAPLAVGVLEMVGDEDEVRERTYAPAMLKHENCSKKKVRKHNKVSC